MRCPDGRPPWPCAWPSSSAFSLAPSFVTQPKRRGRALSSYVAGSLSRGLTHDFKSRFPSRHSEIGRHPWVVNNVALAGVLAVRATAGPDAVTGRPDSAISRRTARPRCCKCFVCSPSLMPRNGVHERDIFAAVIRCPLLFHQSTYITVSHVAATEHVR